MTRRITQRPGKGAARRASPKRKSTISRRVTRLWTPRLRRAGRRYRNIRQARHSFASLLIQQGESLAYVRDQLGHHSIALTVDACGHLVPGANRQAVDRLDDAPPRNPGATTAPAPVAHD